MRSFNLQVKRQRRNIQGHSETRENSPWHHVRLIHDEVNHVFRIGEFPPVDALLEMRSLSHYFLEDGLLEVVRIYLVLGQRDTVEERLGELFKAGTLHEVLRQLTAEIVIGIFA